jgi:hypothetical protein
VGRLLASVKGFLVAFAVGRSVFRLASVCKPGLEGIAQDLGILLLLMFSLLSCLFELFVGVYYTRWLRFLAHNS